MSERENRSAALILAAGKGTRMKSDLPKVMHPVGGRPMLEHVIEQARSLDADPVVAIVGYGKEDVLPLLDRLEAQHVVQHEQLGTGHAVMQAAPMLEDFEGDVLVLSGDVPLLGVETLRGLRAYHRQQDAVATVLTATAPDPTGYGRVLRGPEGNLIAIREHKDASEQEREVDEINSGIYLFRSRSLFAALKRISNDNAQGEYYLPDVFKIMLGRGDRIAAFKGDYEEIQGVNSPEDLARAEQIWQTGQNAS